MGEKAAFFAKARKANERKIVLKETTILRNRAGEKRLRMTIMMPLTGEKMGGYPDVLTAAYEYVAQQHETISTDWQFSGYDIKFTPEQNLFGEKETALPRCDMKKFVVTEMGSSDDPDVCMTFKIYAQFSDKLLRFCGQMAGETFFARFEQGDYQEEEEETDQLQLTPDQETPDGDEEESDEDEEESEDEPEGVQTLG